MSISRSYHYDHLGLCQSLKSLSLNFGEYFNLNYYFSLKLVSCIEITDTGVTSLIIFVGSLTRLETLSLNFEQ